MENSPVALGRSGNPGNRHVFRSLFLQTCARQEHNPEVKLNRVYYAGYFDHHSASSIKLTLLTINAAISPTGK